MQRKLDLTTFINQPAFFPEKIDLPDYWGDSPVVGESIELEGLLKPEDEKPALEFLFESGAVVKVKKIQSHIEEGQHVRVFQMELV